MTKPLPKELAKLLDFYSAQRNSPPEEYIQHEGLISAPTFFTLNQFQQHINNPLLKPEWLHIKTDGKDVPLDASLFSKYVQKRELYFMDKEKINEEIKKGAALVLEGIDLLDPTINAFCAKLEDGLPCGVANSVVFFSQNGNEAYEGHCDTDDVLVIQLGGAKTWQLFEPQQRRYIGIANQSDAKLGPVKHEVTMQPGDAMYVRAGVPHRCITTGKFSLHMSFDLLDRTPDVQQMSSDANRQYLRACESPYVPGTKVIDRYIKILQSPEFRSEVGKQTVQKRMEIIQFRQRAARSASVNSLTKFM